MPSSYGIQGDGTDSFDSVTVRIMKTLTNISASNFEAEVLESVEPVLVDFWAPWCGPCLRIAPEIESISAELEGKVKVVKVNVDSNAELVDRFSVRGIPNLILFKDGKPIDQIIGITNRQTISSTIRRHLSA